MLCAAAMLVEAYRVAQIRSVDGSQPAPPEISERFEGRLFTLQQLEARGIRIAGREAWYLSNGQDWRLTLEPAV
jgi:hypothetical protein